MDWNVSTKCKWTQNAGKTHIFLEMRAAVCYSRDTDIYSQNTSLTNSFQHKTTINLFYAVPDVLRVLF